MRHVIEEGKCVYCNEHVSAIEIARTALEEWKRDKKSILREVAQDNKKCTCVGDGMQRCRL